MRTLTLLFVAFLITDLAAYEKLSFIALIKNRWQIVLCDPTQCQIIKTDSEPRTYDYNPQADAFVYVGSDGYLRLIDSQKREHILKKPKKDAFTQPRFLPNSHKIAAVKLLNKNSKQTKIVLFNEKTYQEKVLLSRHSTVLDPQFVGNSLYYANVECSYGCGKLIQEIWVQKPITGPSKQLTMLGTISRQPAYDPHLKRVYFSSLTHSGFRIFYLEGTMCRPKKLTTFLQGSDTWPTTDSKGNLYFVHIQNGETYIYTLKTGSKSPIPVQLPLQFTKIRNLKVYQ